MRYILCILIGYLPSLLWAQTADIPVPDKTTTADTLCATFRGDLLTAPVPAPFDLYGITPLSYSYAAWELHPGMNANIGMSLTFSPSSWMPSGVGFGQDIALLYATPLTSRLSVAGGVYASNLNWGRLNYRNVGLAAIAAYRLNDRISLYAYGNKSLTQQPTSPLYAPLPQFNADRIGGMVNFKVGKSASIGIGFEGTRYPGGYY